MQVSPSSSSIGLSLSRQRRAGGRFRVSAQREEMIWGYVFLLPWALGFLFFTGGPIIASAIIGFTDYNIILPPEWVGPKNYLALLSDKHFFASVRVTATYAIVVIPVSIAGSLGLALLMNQKLPGVPLFRTLYYMPNVLSGVATAILWVWLFNPDPDMGIINMALRALGISGPKWLQSTRWALPAVMITSLWGIGGSRAVIYLAGLQDVPEQLYESATIDGAGAWSRFRHITVPMMTPMIFFTFITGIIGTLSTFTGPYIMTQGGPGNATMFYGIYLYNKAFIALRMGYASAMAWVMFLVAGLVAVLNFYLARYWVYYEAQR